MLTDTRFAFIGSGAMAEAMIKGLVQRANVAPDHINASGPRPERGDELKARYGIRRAMPNTPAQIGMGMTVWTCVPGLSESQRQQAKAVFGSFGEEVYVDDERYLDMATALSGTGPAYVFIFMEAMVDAGVHMGFSRRVAEQLVYQTVQGSVEYARQAGRHLATLRNQVTSPDGTSGRHCIRSKKADCAR